MKYVFSILGICIAYLATAQTVKISEEVNLRSYTQYEIIGKIKNQVMLLRVNNENFYVHAYNDNMGEKWNKEIKLDKRYPKVLGTHPYSFNSFLIFYRFKSKGDTYIRVQELDDKLKMMDSTTVKVYQNRPFAPSPELIYSQDKSKVLFFHVEGEKKIEAVVLDLKKMKVLWDRKFHPSDFNHSMDFIKAIVDNDGGMHVISQKDNKKFKKEENRFIIYHYDYVNDKSKEYFVSMKGLLWYDVDFDYDNMNQQLVASGLVAEKRTTETNGYFYMTIPPSNPQEYKLHHQEFNKATRTQLLGKELKEGKGFSEITVQEMVLRSDGGVLLIAERNKQYSRRSGVSAPVTAYSSTRYESRDRVDYYYDEILVLSINPDGSLQWSEVLHKKQYSQDDNASYSSYFLVKTRSNLRFIYNDVIKNESPVNEYSLTGVGEAVRKAIFSTDGKDIKLRIRDALQVAADEVIIPSERRQKLRLVRLIY